MNGFEAEPAPEVTIRLSMPPARAPVQATYLVPSGRRWIDTTPARFWVAPGSSWSMRYDACTARCRDVDLSGTERFPSAFGSVTVKIASPPRTSHVPPSLTALVGSAPL